MRMLEPQWYKDAVIYEVHVRAFLDSVGDGHGDFDGLTQKLDYLKDLGVTAIWLLPFYPSPLRDDGYDIAHYTDIHPQYGTLASFAAFMEAAHARDLHVITELVLNHTSDEHAWFQRARRAPPGSSERNFYVWSDTPEKYQDARIIFQDFEASNWTYDRVAKAYFWHRFYSHQPDLNFDNPDVWQMIFPIVDFWLGMGVDGLRLDAVPYLFEREGTNCENLPETHRFLKALRRHVDEKFPNRMLIAEANQWPEDAVAYFGEGDECQMAFHFPIMPRLFMSVQREDRFPIIDILDQTPAIPNCCQWAMFLRNHDELTLEMVTDEERDYMYRVYALESRARINLGIRRRLAPLMSNNRRRIELMNSLLLSLPGTPVVYYGDEIGMGDNIYLGDRNGVRTPMQWSGDRNAGFSRANPQRLFLPVIIDPEYHFESVNVEAQQNNPHSLLWWMKRLIDIRKRYKAFSRGELEFLHPENRRILAFVRTYENERLLVVANLSRYVQPVELDLAAYQGQAPVELFSMSPFPAIGSLPYLLTLGPHSFYWFALTPQPDVVKSPANDDRTSDIPELRGVAARQPIREGDWERLELLLPRFFNRRWSLNGDESIQIAEVQDHVPLAGKERNYQLLHVALESKNGARHTTILPLSLEHDQRAHDLLESHRPLVVCRNGDSVWFDASTDPDFAAAVFDHFEREAHIKSQHGAELVFRKLPRPATAMNSEEPLTVSQVKTDQFNSSMILGNRLVWKLFRYIEDGPHPEVEIGLLLNKRDAAHSAALAGMLEYRKLRGPSATFGVLHAYQPFESDALQRTLDELSAFFERVLTQSQSPEPSPRLTSLFPWSETPLPGQVGELIGDFLEDARLIGQRTAEMHVALSAGFNAAGAADEAFTPLYQRSVYQSIRTLKLNMFHELRRRLSDLPAATRQRALQLLEREHELTGCFRSLLESRLQAVRIRCHGDYHLGQLLHTGKDYVVIDFEGPVRTPLSERRIKRSPLADVASLVRSFDYACRASLGGLKSGRGRTPGYVRAEDVERLAPWCQCWTGWVSACCLQSYLATCRERSFHPASEASIPPLLRAFVLEKNLAELNHELHYRPAWVDIPLNSLLDALDDVGAASELTAPLPN